MRDCPGTHVRLGCSDGRARRRWREEDWMNLLGRRFDWRGRISAVVVVALLVGLVGPVASADNRPHLSKLKGKWSNPVGACVAHIIKVDPTSGNLLSCSGTSEWTGTWKGSSKWVLKGDVSLTAGGSGRIDEVFTGRTRSGRKGKLTFVETFTLDATGIDIRGKIVKSSGGLAGSH